MIANKESISHRECAFMQQWQPNRGRQWQEKERKTPRILCAPTSFCCIYIYMSLYGSRSAKLFCSPASDKRQQRPCRELFVLLFNRWMAAPQPMHCTYCGPTRPALDNGMNTNPKISAKIMKSYSSADRQRFYFICGHRLHSSLFTAQQPKARNSQGARLCESKISK